jgi:hypothetical protein
VFTSKAHTIFGRRTVVALLALAALALPMHAAAAEQVPLNGSESGTFLVIGPCESSGIVVDVTGTGHGAQLGTYTAHYRECFVPATGAVTGGSFTLTTANGDTLFGTYAGHALPTGGSNVRFEDPGVITGGTGRFAAATGTLTQSGVANLATGEYSASISGSVSNPAAA